MQVLKNEFDAKFQQKIYILKLINREVEKNTFVKDQTASKHQPTENKNNMV